MYCIVMYCNAMYCTNLISWHFCSLHCPGHLGKARQQNLWKADYSMSARGRIPPLTTAAKYR